MRACMGECGRRLALILPCFKMLVRAYLGNALPRDTAIQAIDTGLGLVLLADLCAVSGEKNWLDAGLTLAESQIACYFDSVLPRGGAGID